MKFLELTFDQPAANLACDEALLETMETNPTSADCLRLWQPKNYFVVLGHSNPLRASVNLEACNNHRVPVLRRMSGGGTVVQGPGCLNYSLILRHDRRDLRNIGSTFKYVLERHRSFVNNVYGVPGHLEGVSDLAVHGRKFSGNAQYRKACFVLVHGTFLLNFDVSVIETLLPVPERQPAYRRNRPHLQFLTNLQADVARFCESLKSAWDCEEDLVHVPFARIDELVSERYSQTGWVEKF